MGKSVVITGTSSGFGRLTAETLAEAGCEVYATMRAPDGKNREAAEALRAWAGEGGRSLEVVELDVTDDGSVARAAEEILTKTGGVDVVVNNAGVLSTGMVEAFTAEDCHREFDVNVYGALRVTRAFLPKMREKRDGLVIVISSIMGRIILPFAGPYTATKWAVEGLFESWRYELAPLGIDTVIIEPGPFPTELGAKIGTPKDASVIEEYGPVRNIFNRWAAGFEGMFSGEGVPVPQDVADAVRRTIQTPKGGRAFRVVVDTLMPEAPEAINRQYAIEQSALLDLLGLSPLSNVRK